MKLYGDDFPAWLAEHSLYLSAARCPKGSLVDIFDWWLAWIRTGRIGVVKGQDALGCLACKVVLVSLWSSDLSKHFKSARHREMAKTAHLEGALAEANRKLAEVTGAY